MTNSIETIIANELKMSSRRVLSAIKLLDQGCAVPFIARYRKETTEDLETIQLRELDALLWYHRDFDERRSSVLKIINDRGKLTPKLREKILQVTTKVTLADLYQPFKPQRICNQWLALSSPECC